MVRSVHGCDMSMGIQKTGENASRPTCALAPLRRLNLCEFLPRLLPSAVLLVEMYRCLPGDKGGGWVAARPIPWDPNSRWWRRGRNAHRFKRRRGARAHVGRDAFSPVFWMPMDMSQPCTERTIKPVEWSRTILRLGARLGLNRGVGEGEGSTWYCCKIVRRYVMAVLWSVCNLRLCNLKLCNLVLSGFLVCECERVLYTRNRKCVPLAYTTKFQAAGKRGC